MLWLDSCDIWLVQEDVQSVCAQHGFNKSNTGVYTVMPLISFTLSVAEAVISAMGGKGPPAPANPPAGSLPLEPSAPGPEAPLGYPFMA